MAIINGRGIVGIRSNVSAAPSVSSPTIVLDGLKLHLDAGNVTSYPGTGTVWTDISGNGNNGTLNGGVTYNSSNAGSLVFNGSTGYISRANFIGNITTFTVCHWINLSSNQTTRTIFSNYTGNGWVTGISDAATNVIKFYLGGGTLYATYPLVINTWYHVCVTYNNGNPSIYINGILNNTTTGTISFAVGLATNNDIGRLGDGRQYFNGNISNIQVYNRALSASEILQNYNTLKSRFYPQVSDSDAQSFIYAGNIQDSTQANAVNTLVTSLKSNGIWTKMKAIYPMVGGTASSHKFNLKDPRDLDAAFRLTFTAGWVHSSTGAKPNGSSDYADTKFIPLTNFSGNSGHISHYNRTNSVGVKRDISAYAAIGPSNIYSYTNLGGNTNYSRITGNEIGYSNSDTRGLYILNRNSSITSYYKNGVSKASNSSTSAMPENVISIGGGTGGTYSDRETAFVTIGDGLTDTEASNLYTAVQTYQTTLGRQV